MQQNGWTPKLTEILKAHMGSSRATSQQRKGWIDTGFLLIKILSAFDTQWRRESQISTADWYWVYEASFSVCSMFRSTWLTQNKYHNLGKFLFCFVMDQNFCLTEVLFLFVYCFDFYFLCSFFKVRDRKEKVH